MSSYLTSGFECLNLPLHADGCPNFWLTVLIIFLLFCFICIYLLASSYLKEKSIIDAYNEKQKRRAAIADDVVMEQNKWNSDFNP